jgi:monofunctional biosynthetic peptidoglycan transglycosylase
MIDVSPASPDFIALAEVPPLFLRALLLAEDAGFYGHPGIDLREVPAALLTDWARGGAARGASTITQQLAKNLWLSPSRNPLRKLKEAALTRQLERHLSKRRILELYLNVVEFGPGVWGCESAARRYFGKPAAALTEREAAELAASLPRPSTWHPGARGRGYARHVERILARMRGSSWVRREL